MRTLLLSWRMTAARGRIRSERQQVHLPWGRLSRLGPGLKHQIAGGLICQDAHLICHGCLRRLLFAQASLPPSLQTRQRDCHDAPLPPYVCSELKTSLQESVLLASSRDPDMLVTCLTWVVLEGVHARHALVGKHSKTQDTCLNACLNTCDILHQLGGIMMCRTAL